MCFFGNSISLENQYHWPVIFKKGIEAMKKFFASLAAFAALTASASAADLAARPYTKAAPMIAASYDWSGFYMGINGGGGWSRKCWDFVSVAGALSPEGCHDASGGTAGGQIGWRAQS